MQKSIYISYNPNSTKEEHIAHDLYRKGRQNGYFIYLPVRGIHKNITLQTKANIDNSDWFVVFSTSELTATVKEEIEYAFNKKDDSQVIIIYSHHYGKNIDFQGKKPIEMYVDDYDLNKLEKFKNDLFTKITPKKNSIQKNEGVNGLKVLLGVGAAILLLNALTSDNNE